MTINFRDNFKYSESKAEDKVNIEHHLEHVITPELRKLGRLLASETGPKAYKHNTGETVINFGGSKVSWSKNRGILLGEVSGESSFDTDSMSPSEVYDAITNCLCEGRSTERYPVGVGLEEVYLHIPNDSHDSDWRYLTRSILEDGDQFWDFDAIYQRPVVWTTKQQSEFIGHVLRGGSVPPMYIHLTITDTRDEYEVLDGKQRLSAITSFISGKITATLPGGRLVYYKNFNEREKRHRCLSSKIVTVKDMSLADRMRFYLRLNDSGVRHSEEDISKVKNLLRESGTEVL